MRRAIGTAALAAVAALAGCYTPSQAELEAEADRLAAMAGQSAAEVEAAVQAAAAACGTQASFAGGAVLVLPAATDAQLACVRQRYPTARRSGQ